MCTFWPRAAATGGSIGLVASLPLPRSLALSPRPLQKSGSVKDGDNGAGVGLLGLGHSSRPRYGRRLNLGCEW